MKLEDEEYWKSMINMALTKFLILRTLYHQSSHGYAILEKLTEFTSGCCTPTFGAIYPILRDFVSDGYATVESKTVNGRKRKIYSLTEKGKNAYECALSTWREVIPYLQKAVDELEDTSSLHGENPDQNQGRGEKCQKRRKVSRNG
ncbi:MAG: PadR family transcriptional regulator [Methanomassiliicoccales archaeon]|nr:PadR family transcriptional regulator [Methanomassiliicoccales archaeon]